MINRNAQSKVSFTSSTTKVVFNIIVVVIVLVVIVVVVVVVILFGQRVRRRRSPVEQGRTFVHSSIHLLVPPQISLVRPLITPFRFQISSLRSQCSPFTPQAT